MRSANWRLRRTLVSQVIVSGEQNNPGSYQQKEYVPVSKAAFVASEGNSNKKPFAPAHFRGSNDRPTAAC